MNDKLTSKGMMVDIFAQRKFAKQLLGRGKDYDQLLKLLTEKDYYYDEDIPFPSIKELIGKLNISYTVFKRQISQIYNDLSEIYTNDIDYSINDIEYIFSLNFLGKFVYAKLKNLPATPRVGELIDIPFFKEKVHSDLFYVKSVHHSFTDSKQTVYLTLVVGQYNIFWNYFRDEKFARRQMSRDDYNSTDESKIRGKFGFTWI